VFFNGQGGRIRPCDPLVANQIFTLTIIYISSRRKIKWILPPNKPPNKAKATDYQGLSEVGGGLFHDPIWGDLSTKSLLPSAVKVFFVFPFSAQQAGLGENKKSLLRFAQGGFC
jgi:hypothetical protein